MKKRILFLLTIAGIFVLVAGCKKDKGDTELPSIEITLISNLENVIPGDAIKYNVKITDNQQLSSVSVSPSIMGLNDSSSVHKYADSKSVEFIYTYVVPDNITQEVTITFIAVDKEYNINRVYETISFANVQVHMENITEDQVWSADKIHVVAKDYLGVTYSATLTILKGTTVIFNGQARGFYIGGGAKFIASGTEAEPIKLISLSGYEIAIDDENAELILNHCDLEKISVTASPYCHCSPTVSIDNCTFLNSPSHGVKSFYGFKSLENNKFISPYSHPVAVGLGYAHLLPLNNEYILDKENTGIYIWGGGNFPENCRWKKHSIPYIYASRGASVNNKLVIDPGVEIKFLVNENDPYFVCFDSDTIIAKGTPEEPIKFSLHPDSEKSYWQGFLIQGEASQLILENCELNDVRYFTLFSKENRIIDCNFNNSESSSPLFWMSHSGLAGSFKHFYGNTFSNVDILAKINANYLHTIGPDNDYSNVGKITVEGDLNIDGNYFWENIGCTYEFLNGLNIGSDNGVYLDIEPGVNLLFGNNTSLNIGVSGKANLVTHGSVDNPVIFTSASDSPVNGIWNGINIGNNVASVVFNYCNISYGGAGQNANVVLSNTGTNVSITNSQINNSAGYGIFIDQNSTPTLTNNTFSGNVLDDVFYQ
ncbi:MAG: hypothetical protein P1P88_01000 [Bacteroidales bacterium]|nr:hypothetical protein [Bacteroidales bacterium]